MRASLASKMHLIVRHQSLQKRAKVREEERAEKERRMGQRREGVPCMDEVGRREVSREDKSETLLSIFCESAERC
jgi:hypothetical protein